MENKKVSIIYYSKMGNTKKMVDIIANGLRSVKDIEVGVFSVDSVDEDFLRESKTVIFGTPTYYGNTCWQIKKWFDESKNISLEGKLGATFATCDYVQGGASTAMLTIINHMMVKGMLVYSGGSALGQPFLHFGPVALKGRMEEVREEFFIYGRRIGNKTVELF
ncbi:flavodoxin family protein [Clostridium cellulovorans]|uniref:Flavodoxin/nitric oxide synthase n=1 Tax=Clostridium cellulovorans (strain ATCC 35296 / DSM 3052 / OCM 3 / 743B) TaxID=573061 RepID=D9SUE6_CLOC7|nr:flavodoxin domain-containing protein [Clostridium cellulovorans]ADL52901.1 flavodoxin/nitric oxide synthase [Clostridium cellulovorans 743B]